MAWIKLEDTFHDHPKFRKLARRLDIPQVYAKGLVASLWTWTLRHAADGDLSSFDHEDIELASEWAGPVGHFVKACLEVKLIDDVDGKLYVHGWMRRAESYKRAKQKEKERVRTKASPDGRPTTSSRRYTEEREEREERRSDVENVIAHYQTYHPKSKPGTKEKKLIQDRMVKDSFTAPDLCRAIDGQHRTPHNQGVNSRNKKYLSLALAVRDSEKVNQYMAAFDELPPWEDNPENTKLKQDLCSLLPNEEVLF